MEITVSKHNDLTIIAASGKMNVSTTGAFSQAVVAELAKKPKGLLIDLDGLDYMSSAGLRSVLICYKECLAKKIPLAFCALEESVYEVICISGFSKKLRIYETREQAIGCLA